MHSFSRSLQIIIDPLHKNGYFSGSFNFGVQKPSGFSVASLSYERKWTVLFRSGHLDGEGSNSQY